MRYLATETESSEWCGSDIYSVAGPGYPSLGSDNGQCDRILPRALYPRSHFDSPISAPPQTSFFPPFGRKQGRIEFTAADRIRWTSLYSCTATCQ